MAIEMDNLNAINNIIDNEENDQEELEQDERYLYNLCFSIY
jgi:hypothetical protein